MPAWLRGHRATPGGPPATAVGAPEVSTDATSANAMGSSAPWLVVGLGNPGPTYAGNRHNAGFMVVDHLADRWQGRFSGHRSRAEVVSLPGFAGRVGLRALLAKPRTFMNESGGPVAGVRDYFSVPLDHVIVVHDELDLPYGTLRLKRGGGDGGHNGLKSITRSLGTPDYFRVRFGIGRPPGRMDPAAFVLRDFSGAERTDLEFLVDRAADAVQDLVTVGLATAQNTYHPGSGASTGQ